MERCLFCGGDLLSPDHWRTCDGRQGKIEAAAREADVALAARTSDPETSRDAMAAYDEDRMRSAMDCVVRLHRERGPMAGFELKAAFAAAWGRPCDDSLHRQARNQARRNGWIRNTGRRRTCPSSGQEQIVWEACHEAPPAIQRCETCGAVLRPKKTA